MVRRRHIPPLINDGKLNSSVPVGTPLCGAETNKVWQGGRPCRMAAMANGRCRMHGGKNLSGISHPFFGKGKSMRSPYIPDRLRARFEETLADPDYLSLREDMALLESRLMELMGRVEGSTTPDWAQVGQLTRQLVEALDDENPKEARTIAVELRTMARKGRHDGQIWQQIQHLLQDRRKIVDTETRRLVGSNKLVPIEKVMMLVSRLGVSVATHAREHPEILRAVQSDITQLLGPSAIPEPSGSDDADGHWAGDSEDGVDPRAPADEFLGAAP